jgi:hypothetical protein
MSFCGDAIDGGPSGLDPKMPFDEVELLNSMKGLTLRGLPIADDVHFAYAPDDASGTACNIDIASLAVHESPAQLLLANRQHADTVFVALDLDLPRFLGEYLLLWWAHLLAAGASREAACALCFAGGGASAVLVLGATSVFALLRALETVAAAHSAAPLATPFVATLRDASAFVRVYSRRGVARARRGARVMQAFTPLDGGSPRF